MAMNLEKYTQFCKVSDIKCDRDKSEDKAYDVVNEFLDNYISSHPNKGTLIKNLSNMYVLMAVKNAFWKRRLSKSENYLLDTNSRYIIGFIDPIKFTNNIHYIYYIDTRLRGMNIGRYMIEKYNYEMNNNDNTEVVHLLPQEVVETAAAYWKKFFEDEYDCHNVEDLERLIEELSLEDHGLKWDHMIAEYEDTMEEGTKKRQKRKRRGNNKK
jgi:hypothetical protein